MAGGGEADFPVAARAAGGASHPPHLRRLRSLPVISLWPHLEPCVRSSWRGPLSAALPLDLGKSLEASGR